VLHKFMHGAQRIFSSIHRRLHETRQSQSRAIIGTPTPPRDYPWNRDASSPRYPMAMVSEYYQHIHETNDAYKSNNWLLSEINSILSIAPRSILEIGCGNGRFLAAVRGRVERIIGVDWAQSPMLDELGVSADFALRNITSDDLPKVDLACSADVLEHLPPDLLLPTLHRINSAGKDQYHVIACYDDGHSHLSIMEPQAWLQIFQSISQRYKLIDVRPRRNDRTQLICVIATFQPKTLSSCNRAIQVATAPPSGGER
jgi:SAM-dependent methyltransferase